MQLYVTYAAQAVKHLVDNLRLVSVATLPSCGSYAAALHLQDAHRPNNPSPLMPSASRQRSDLDHAENRHSVAMETSRAVGIEPQERWNLNKRR